MEKLRSTASKKAEISAKRISQKPARTETDATIELINSGVTETPLQLGKVVFDTPHLSKHNKADNFMVVHLPLMVQNEIQDLIERKFPQYRTDGTGIVFFRGQMNADNIFFKRIEEIKPISHLPDIMITTDVNSLYHSDESINENNFEVFQYTAHPAFSGTGLVKPGMAMRYLAADALVFVVDRTKYEQSSFPVEWYELLHPALEKRIVFCGDKDFYCHTIYAHYVRDFGLDALKQLNKNTCETMHPVDMIHALQSGCENASIYVMPYSYARMIENHIDYQIVWPEDGAIILPVQMLVKKGTYERNKDLISLLTSAEAGRVFALNGLVPVNRNTDCGFSCGKLNWLGWDFLKSTDLKELKKNIAACLA